ncbi:MAG: thioredoxin family protein [Saprospiraceae bacterium]
MVSKLTLTFFLIFTLVTGFSQDLQIIEQDYARALSLAEAEDKLLFVDFYTTWCLPCKELDEWVFKNDSVTRPLAENFVLLRYDAENDRVFHLSKKHHLISYPTAIILNSDGAVINRKYGFSGDDEETLSNSVLEFSQESLHFHQDGMFLKGYSTDVDTMIYPKFYIDFVNRDDIMVLDRPEFEQYWKNSSNALSEGYFSTLSYFAADVPEEVGDLYLKNKTKYTELFGKLDVDLTLYFLIAERFERAIESKSRKKFDRATAYLERAYGKEKARKKLPYYLDAFEEALKE